MYAWVWHSRPVKILPTSQQTEQSNILMFSVRAPQFLPFAPGEANILTNFLLLHRLVFPPIPLLWHLGDSVTILQVSC
jgi:hypothetical protein